MRRLDRGAFNVNLPVWIYGLVLGRLNSGGARHSQRRGGCHQSGQIGSPANTVAASLPNTKSSPVTISIMRITKPNTTLV